MEEEYMSIELNIHGIRCIHTGLKQACEKWSGGDPNEQIAMQTMRDNFFRLILEYQVNGY